MMSFRILLLSANAIIFMICSVETAGIINKAPISLYLAASAFFVVLYIAVMEALINKNLSQDISKREYQSLIDLKKYQHLQSFVKRMRDAEQRISDRKD